MGAPYRMMLDLFFGFAPRESVVLTEFDFYMHPGIISFGSDGRFPPPPPPQKKRGETITENHSKENLLGFNYLYVWVG